MSAAKKDSVDLNIYMPNSLAAEMLGIKASSMYGYTFKNEGDDFIKVDEYRGKRDPVYVKRSWVAIKLERKHLADIYTPLMEKYTSEENIIKEVIKRTDRTYAAVYQAVRVMCMEPASIVGTKITEALCEMAKEIEKEKL